MAETDQNSPSDDDATKEAKLLAAIWEAIPAVLLVGLILFVLAVASDELSTRLANAGNAIQTIGTMAAIGATIFALQQLKLQRKAMADQAADSMKQVAAIERGLTLQAAAVQAHNDANALEKTNLEKRQAHEEKYLNALAEQIQEVRAQSYREHRLRGIQAVRAAYSDWLTNSNSYVVFLLQHGERIELRKVTGEDEDAANRTATRREDEWLNWGTRARFVDPVFLAEATDAHDAIDKLHTHISDTLKGTIVQRQNTVGGWVRDTIKAEFFAVAGELAKNVSTTLEKLTDTAITRLRAEEEQIHAGGTATLR